MGRLRAFTVRRCLAVASATTLLFLAAAYLAGAAGGLPPWSGLASGGGTRSSASFRLSDSVGQGEAVGMSRSQQFSLISGFQAGTRPGATQPPAPGTFNLTISVLGSGTTSPPPGVHSYPDGTPVVVAAAPASGWVFGYWSGDASGSAPATSITMNGHRSVTASFAPRGTTLIGAIRQDPAAYEGRPVRVSGQYRGSEAGYGPPPISRGDWVVRDATGSLYVSGSQGGLRHPADIGRPVTVNGTVRVRNGQPYIEVARDWRPWPGQSEGTEGIRSTQERGPT